jgi:hypothetical protein
MLQRVAAFACYRRGGILQGNLRLGQRRERDSGGATSSSPRARSPMAARKQDFAYLADEDVYRCPSSEKADL